MGKLFKSIGKALLGLAPAVVAGGVSITPAAAAGLPGALIGICGAILRSVLSAQAGYPLDAHDAKRTEVEGTFDTIHAIVTPMVSAIGGSGDPDEDRVRSAYSKIAEGFIDLMKGYHFFPTKEAGK